MKDSKYKIHLFKEQKEIDCPKDSSILEATLAASINHTHACGGQGKCSTCRVSVMKGIQNCSPRNAAEQAIADKLNFPKEIRLACQTEISGNITIRRIVSDKLDLDIISEQFSANAGIALGSQQKLTVVFTDIINYTAFAEKFPPYDTVHVLNRYYRIMNTIIEEHINGMNEKLEIFNVYLKENFNIEFGIRAGVHFGKVIIGPFDTGKMKKLAIIGDNVNYASRIESANKEFDTKLLLSKEAYKKVKKKGRSGNINFTKF